MSDTSSVVADPQTPPPTKKKSGKKIALIGCGGLLGFFIILLIIYALIPKEERERMARERVQEQRLDSVEDVREDAREKAEEVQRLEEESARAAAALDSMRRVGVMVSVDSLREIFSDMGYALVLEKRTLNDGRTAYNDQIDGSANILVEAVGDKSNPESITFIGMVDGTNREVDTKTMTTIVSAVDAIEKGAGTWAATFIKNTTGKQTLERTEVMGTHTLRGQFHMLEKVEMVTITVKPTP